MGKLLIDVLNLEKEGLVGFTEIGEQVPLKFLVSDRILQLEKEQLIKERNDKEYVLFLQEDIDKVTYVVYEERA